MITVKDLMISECQSSPDGKHWEPAQPQQETVAVGSLDSLKLSMQHSAWDGVIQLSDALQNIDDFAKEQPAQRTDDTKRLDALAENSWDLRCFDMPTGAGDGDIGWRVVEHHMAKPHERTVAEVFRDDPRQAIDEAIKAATETKDAP